jgi:hypothetical protein
LPVQGFAASGQVTSPARTQAPPTSQAFSPGGSVQSGAPGAQTWQGSPQA